MEGGDSDNEPKRVCKAVVGSENAAAAAAPASIQELNPLENPLILETIFAHCSTTQLSWCRLVCKAWGEISLSTWRASAALTVRQHGYENIVMGNPVESNRHIPLADFLWHLQHNNFRLRSKPFKHLVFRKVNFEFKKYMELYSPDAIKILLSGAGLGRSLTTLELHDCRFHTINDFRRVIYGLFPKLKTLIIFSDNVMWGTGLGLRHEPEVVQLQYTPPTYGERPNLRTLSVKADKFTGKPVVSWLELLSHFPQLDVLTVSGDSISSHALLIDLLSAINIIREHDGTKLPLRTFDVQAIIPLTNFLNGQNERIETVCDLLEDLELSLSSLDLKLEGIHQLTPVDTSELLDVNKMALQRIRIRARQEHARLIFPLGIRLENLTELEMSQTLCSNMEFLKLMPNLKELRIVKWSHEFNYSIAETTPTMVTSSRKRVMADVKLNKLTVLKLEPVGRMSNSDIISLTKWMPNVAMLSICLNDKQFGIVCKRWRNLKKLEDFGKELTDKGVTGVGAATWNQQSNGEGTGVTQNIMSLLPNITWLKRLQYFRSGSRNLTNASVYNGFLKMPKLKHICFDCSLQALEFGGDARQALMLNCVRLSTASQFCSDCTAEKS